MSEKELAASALLQLQRQFGDELLAKGMTPFDLCSWTTLLFLLGATDTLSGDLDVWHSVRSTIEEAARRKATLLDAEKNTDFHISTLESYGVR